MHNPRKIILTLIAGLLLLHVSIGISFAGDRDIIRVFQIWSSESIDASGSDTSDMIVDLAQIKPVGHFSLQITLTGDGTAKFEYLVSNDGIAYVESSNATDIVTGFTKTSGNGSDGKDLIPFSPEVSRYLKLKVTETGGASAITVTSVLAIQ